MCFTSTEKQSPDLAALLWWNSEVLESCFSDVGTLEKNRTLHESNGSTSVDLHKQLQTNFSEEWIYLQHHYPGAPLFSAVSMFTDALNFLYVIFARWYKYPCIFFFKKDFIVCQMICNYTVLTVPLKNLFFARLSSCSHILVIY